MLDESGGLGVERNRLSSQVASIIREQVLLGRLGPGVRVVQTEWAERLGVSRMPVRDAINTLCSEGILVQGNGASAEVASVDIEDIEDGYYLNGVVASVAARRAATRLTDSELERLEAIHDRMREAVSGADTQLASRLNWEFHHIVNKGARSPRVIALLQTLANSTSHSAFEILPGWPERALRDHERLLKALKARDGDTAGRLMEEHVVAGSKPMVTDVRKRLRATPASL